MSEGRQWSMQSRPKQNVMDIKLEKVPSLVAAYQEKLCFTFNQILNTFHSQLNENIFQYVVKHFIFNFSTDCSCLTHLKTHLNLIFIV